MIDPLLVMSSDSRGIPWRKLQGNFSQICLSVPPRTAVSMRVSIALSLTPAFRPVLLHNGMGASRFNGLPSIPCPGSPMSFGISLSTIVFADRMKKPLKRLSLQSRCFNTGLKADVNEKRSFRAVDERRTSHLRLHPSWLK